MSTPKQETDKQIEEMKERLEEFDADIRHLREEQKELDHTDEKWPRFYEDDNDYNGVPPEPTGTAP